MPVAENFPNFCMKHLSLFVLLWWISLGNFVVDGGKAKSKVQGKIDSVKSGSEHIAVVETDDVIAQNYQGAVFLYPPGIRSERDIPVCISKKQPSEHDKDATEEMMVGDMAVGVSGDFGFSNKTLSSRDLLVGRRDSADNLDRWESACNLIHNRYFFSPIVERLCRCPERTECPWEWSQPPGYPNAPQNLKKGNTSSQPKGGRDPFTIMLSSRSQAKFCTEVTSALPKCHHHKKSETSKQKPEQTNGQKNEQISSKLANLVKTMRKVGGVDEAPKVAVNCFCPPLFRQWKYVGQTEPKEFGNGTLEANYYYKCDKLPRCKTNDRCGNIRTDLHFSFYHCTCPKNHLCLPKVYPVESVDDVEEDVNEVLFKGQVAPAFCTPFTP